MSYLTHVSEHDTLVPQFTKGDRLAKARKTAGIGQQEMAQLLLRDRKTIGNWENDHTEPTPRVLIRWAELTKVPLWWLTDGEPADSEPGSKDRRAPAGLRKPSSGCTIDTSAVRRPLTVVPLGEVDEDVAA